MDRNETATRVLYGATIVVAADQLTKTAVSSLGDAHTAWLLPLRNHGLSFQLVTAGRWVEVALMAAVLALSAWPLIRTAQNRRAPSWAVALILGGAAGNVLDRMLFSSVRDFLPLGHLVVINLADVAIITGLATTGFTLCVTGAALGAGTRGLDHRSPETLYPETADPSPRAQASSRGGGHVGAEPRPVESLERARCRAGSVQLR